MKIYIGSDSTLVSHYSTEPLSLMDAGVEITEAELAWLRSTTEEHDCVQDFLREREK